MWNEIIDKEKNLEFKIISDYTFDRDKKNDIPKWQLEELDKTDNKILNWEVEYIDSDKFDKSILDYIKNLYSNESKSVL